jgi:DNA helicase-2/ATP-dependent DNA helicase PcrA
MDETHQRGSVQQMDASSLLSGLTDPQSQAVQHVEGPLLVLAGPGSGKTRVVTHRIANLLLHGVPDWQIAALTFTNKAADEMQQRLDRLVPGREVWMGTFHRFCAQLLRRHATMVGLKENYSILDSKDSLVAVKRAIQLAGVSTSHTSPERIANEISRAKNQLLTPEILQSQNLNPLRAVAAQVYPVYQRQLLTANAVDFDDLLLHIANLLRQNPEMRQQLDARFRFLMVDEYQDTNLAQYAIVRALSIDHPNLSVTGDPDQSIYGWRGADVNNILDFEKDYPSVTCIRLEQNFRSTPTILAAADHLIQHNRRRKAKRLFTENADGEMVVLRHFVNNYQEADGIADEIVRAVAEEGASLGDFAIFCRTNSLTRSLEHSLRGRSVAYQIISGVEFYQRAEIKDLIAFLNLINNPDHDVALGRVINTPPRGIGAKTVEHLQRYADQQAIPMMQACREVDQIVDIKKRGKTMIKKFVEMYDLIASKFALPVMDQLKFVIEKSGYDKHLDAIEKESEDQSRRENVDEFVNAAAEYDRKNPEDGSLEGFLEQVALISDTDAFDDSGQAVSIMTLHACKGLEFPRVFIIAVEDHLLPHERSRDDEAQFEEERRLLFVGMTRAEQWLQLSYCKSRAMRGDLRPAIASPFLNELPLQDMRQIESTPRQDWFDSEFDQSSQFDDDMPVFQVGDSAASDTSGDASFDFGANQNAVDEFPEIQQDSGDDEPTVKEPMPAESAKAKAASLLNSVKTAADLATGANAPLTAYSAGRRVMHDSYGEGTIIKVSGRGPKCIAKIAFADGEHDFRLAFAKLQLLDD